MKVNEILTEQFDDCVDNTYKEIFHDEYEDIRGVMGMDMSEILDIVQNIIGKQTEVNFKKEEKALDKLIDLEDTGTIFIPKALQNNINELEKVIQAEDENVMQTAIAIQNLVRMLSKNATLANDWKDSEKGAEALVHAEEICGQSDNQYTQSGMRERDF